MIKFTLDTLLGTKDKTRYWLSKQTNIDNNTLAKIYNNSSTKINLDTMDKICKALDCDLTELITYTKE